MPLHDLGYRAWEGAKTSLLGRWSVIASTGISLAFRSTWLSRTLILSVIPTIGAAVLFFFFEQSIVSEDFRRPIAGIASAAGGSAELVQAVLMDPVSVRSEVWASIMLVFFRYSQSFAMLVIVGIIAPRLISYDLRNRGYLLYFSRPMSPAGYIFGKSLVIAAFLAMIGLLPALVLYCLGLTLSPDLDVLLLTWDLPLRIVVASLVVMIPVTAIALTCSSFTVESRYAAFAWFAFWILGWVCYSVLRVGEMAGARRGGGGRRFRRQGNGPELLEYSDWEILSPFHVLGRVQQYVFGLYPEDQVIWPFILVLVGISAFGFWFVRRQILARLSA